MAVLTSANYVFLPWVRQGAASGIAAPDSLGAGQAGVVATTARLRLNDSEEITRQVRLYGPGDVTGIDPQQVVRTEPHPLSLDFEPNYFPAIEFDRPDFPWLFTPAQATADGKLRPWLCLVAVRKQEGVTLRTDRTLPLPLLEIRAPAQPMRELPDLADSWAWAHAQVIGTPREGSALQAALAGEPELAVSRLLCPRRLDPMTEYLACLVPAFELGRKAGLGIPIERQDEQRLEPAWDFEGEPTTAPVTLPVYFYWEFRTGNGGDFESLVGLLRACDPRDLPPQVGKRPIDISRPGFAVTPAPAESTLLELQGALRIADAASAGWPQEMRGPFQAGLKKILDAPWQALSEESAAEPLLAPPIYGGWQAARHTVEPPGEPASAVHWLDELNLDPRNRAVAALGTAVVQAQQEQLMASAWEQLGEIDRINQIRRQAQLARAVNSVYFTNVFSRLDEEEFYRFVAPAQSRMVLTEALPGQLPGTAPVKILLAQAIANSALPSSVVSAPIRRLARPRGAINKQSLRAGTTGTAGMVRLFNAGTSSLSRQVVPDNGVVTIDKVSQGVVNAIQSAGGFLWNPDPPAHWERPRATLMKMLEQFRLSVIAGSGLFSQPPPNTARELLGAMRAHHDYLNQLFTQAIPGPRRALAVKGAALASLNPEKTIAARVSASLTIATGAGQDGDLLAPIMDAPEFPQPMYEALRDLSQEFLLPGLEHVPPNSVTLLETNPQFVESFLVGLNAEMGSELLWRNYPTDQRGTYFRHFWDRSAGDEQPDIEKISRWGERALGQNARAAGNLVLLVRGELLRRYPNSVIYAVAAVQKAGRLGLSVEAQDERAPLFRGTLNPDVTFLGFDLTPAEAVADPGWFFVIQQQPTEPRFGLDAADFGAPEPTLTTWNDLSWRHLAKSQAELAALSHAPVATDLPEIGGVNWGKTAAHQAFITLQRPVRIAIHARQMIKQGSS